jgi:hypothetical protein
LPEKGYTKRVPRWTEEMVTDAIKRYHERYGEVPASTDFNPSDSRRSARISAARSLGWLERAERVERDGDYPLPATVQKLFGTWIAGVKAAGLTPRTWALDPRVAEARYVAPDSLQKIMARLRAAKDPELRQRLLYELADAALGLARGAE